VAKALKGHLVGELWERIVAENTEDKPGYRRFVCRFTEGKE